MNMFSAERKAAVLFANLAITYIYERIALTCVSVS